MSLATRAILFICLNFACDGQTLRFPTFPTPKMLIAGGGAADLMLFNQDYPSGVTALWNGSARPVVASGTGNIYSYVVKLTADDLAAPQLATVQMVDPNGAVIDTVYFPVGYNIVPTGMAIDRQRNRLYLGTPSKPGDPRFPANSVVALDLNSGTIGPVLNSGGRMGDVALSDDGTALYALIEGMGVVRRIDPATFTIVGDFNFRPAPTSLSDNVGVSDAIIVMPGHPDTVAVFSDTTSELAIFDRGVKRVNSLVMGTSLTASILFSPDGKYLFRNGTTGFASGPSEGDYRPATFRYSVDATGIPKQDPVSAVGGAAAIIVQGTLYTALATTIDYAAMQTTGNFGIGGPITVDPANQRAFILYTPPPISDEGQTPPPELRAFSLPGLQALGAQPVGITWTTMLNDTEKLLHFGADGMIVPTDLGLLVFHTPVAAPAPAFTVGAVVNAASQQAGAIAPGEILTIYGTHLGPTAPQVAVSQAGFYPSVTGNTQVRFGNYVGRTLLAYTGQINVVAPFELAPGASVDVQVLNFGIPSPEIPISVAAAAPALFSRNGSGSGAVAVINQDGTVNTASPPGSVVTLFGTGAGFFGGAVDGAIARQASMLSAPVKASVAGRDVTVLYAGAAPGLINGVFQINLQLPRDLPSGFASIVVNAAGQNSPKGATLEIR